MAANDITNLHEKSSHEVELKKKNFRWTMGMVEDLVNCLADYKVKMEYQSLDFDADRPQQIKEVRMEMAKKYENGEFGLVTVTPPKKPLTEMSVDEKIVYLKNKKMENGQIQKGDQRVQEKIKEIRQGFAKAVTVGTRSGSGKIVFEFYDKLSEIWGGGSPSTEPLPFGVETGNFVSAVESEQTTTDVEAEKDVEKLIEDEEGCQIELPAAVRKRAATNQIPILVDNKRKHLERNLSAAQRDHLMMNEAKEERELRIDLGN